MVCDVRATVAILCLTATPIANAGDLCPTPLPHTPVLVAPDDHRIHIDSDAATLGTDDGSGQLQGRVIIRQDARSISADSVSYDKAGHMAVKGAVDFEDPKVRVRSVSGDYDARGTASFDQAQFQLLDRNGRGFAHELAVRPGSLALTDVRYTSCPVGNQDWMIQASSITLDTEQHQGRARGMVLRFKGIPILYTPIFTFPLGNERKSGFLFPNFRHSGKSGYELSSPYYFNLAPNYDITLTPGILTARGVYLDAESRILTKNSSGQIDISLLPSDALAMRQRSYLHLHEITDFKQGLRFDVDIASVSDSNYFQDFAIGSEQTSVTYLERRANLLYYDDSWRVRAQLQNFQTIDTSILANDRPYARVPGIQAQGIWPLLHHFEFAFNSEAINFLRNIGPSGVRVDLAPELRWSTRAAAYFFEPALGWRFTQYDLNDTGIGKPSAPTRALPFVRLDGGLVFERAAGSEGQRTNTLEPRVVYSYIPYRNQDALPIFDSGLPDLNLTELFRTNRYVGADRVSDANNLSLGVTTRLFDHHSGQQYLSATLGQIRYFQDPRVILPCTNLPCETPEHRNSDVVGQILLTAYKNWSVNMDYQWNPDHSKTEKSEFSIRYHPDAERQVNFGYRYQPNVLLKQWDGSFAWPINSHWNSVGRMVYSVQGNQTIERVAGFEYKSCCWRVQVVQRRYLSTRATGAGNRAGLDTSYALQFELTGLSAVERPSDSFLERSIRGYASRD